MQIVTDRGSDFAAGQLDGLPVHFVPMRLTLDGKTYLSGDDLSSAEFYDMLEKTDGLPVTSQATAGDFAEIYRRLAKEDAEILSIHISSGLSGTLNSAKLGAEMAPEAHVTFWDTLTLSCPEAWQVEMAAKAIKVGWPIEKVLVLLARIRTATEGMFTLDTLKYLIHGGRISHLKGLLASLLHIRPVIGVEKKEGKYYTIAQEITMKRAVLKLANSLRNFFPEGTRLRVQLMHGKNPEALEHLREAIGALFVCNWLTPISVAPVLGAHTGGSVVGVCAAPAAVFEDVV
jgi:DegV family protein with EDD domain